MMGECAKIIVLFVDRALKGKNWGQIEDILATKGFFRRKISPRHLPRTKHLAMAMNNLFKYEIMSTLCMIFLVKPFMLVNMITSNILYIPIIMRYRAFRPHYFVLAGSLIRPQNSATCNRDANEPNAALKLAN